MRKHYNPSGDSSDQGIAKRRNEHHRLGARIAGEAREGGAHLEGGMQSNKEKSLEFLTHALAEVNMLYAFDSLTLGRLDLAQPMLGGPALPLTWLVFLKRSNGPLPTLTKRTTPRKNC